MKKLGKVCLLASFFSLIGLGLSNTKKADAMWQSMDWKQTGKKDYSDSYVLCSFDGIVKGHGTGFFSNDVSYWSGTSKAAWYGVNPYNADSITLTDVIWIDGIGSFSAGYPSGVTATYSSGGRMNYSYTVNNEWQMTVYYDYTGEIYSATYTGQKVSASFKFGKTFVVVDSESNQTYEYKGPIKYWFE